MSDGRNIDPTLGSLTGEGSQQRVAEKEARLDQIARDAWEHVPSVGSDGRPNETYYDRPVLKEPVWKWYVPAYFYAGGAAGAAAVLGAVAQAIAGDEMRGLVRRTRWISASGCAAGTVFLILDLGRPERFLNMMRVFRPTSPMSVGSYVLAAAAPLSASAAVLANAPGALGALGNAAGYAAGVAGLPLAGYTAVLVSNSAIPVWQEIGRTLPALFAASAATSAASLLEMTALTDLQARVVHRFGLAGRIAELAAAEAVEREAMRIERVGRPLKEGFSGALWKASKIATAMSLVVSVLPIKSRLKRTVAGVLGSAGAIGMRMAIFQAGVVSARDPRATFEHQRAGQVGTESTEAERAVRSQG